MTSSPSDSEVSEQSAPETQTRVRKRRKLSPSHGSSSDSEHEIIPKPSLLAPSRVEIKQGGLTSDPKGQKNSLVKEKRPTFAAINVAPWLVASLLSMQIKEPTPIQKECIPEILRGRDCIGGSRTGTGKTVAFSVPILQKWAEDPCGIFGVIIT